MIRNDSRGKMSKRRQQASIFMSDKDTKTTGHQSLLHFHKIPLPGSSELLSEFRNSDGHDLFNASYLIQPPVDLPSIEEIYDSIGHKFDKRCIKQIYRQFKNVCSNGRMQKKEFEEFIAYYLPETFKGEYAQRLYNAFVDGKNFLTFQDLIMTLAQHNVPSPKLNAEWTVRMMVGQRTDRISYTDLMRFVRCISELKIRCAMQGEADGCAENVRHIVQSVNDILMRFHRSEDGYIEFGDLVEFFEHDCDVDPVFAMYSSINTINQCS